jgi:hypothetical protein
MIERPRTQLFWRRRRSLLALRLPSAEAAREVPRWFPQRSLQIPPRVLQRVSCEVQCLFPRQAFPHSRGDNRIGNRVCLGGLALFVRVNLCELGNGLFSI